MSDSAREMRADRPALQVDPTKSAPQRSRQVKPDPAADRLLLDLLLVEVFGPRLLPSSVLERLEEARP